MLRSTTALLVASLLVVALPAAAQPAPEPEQPDLGELPKPESSAAPKAALEAAPGRELPPSDPPPPPVAQPAVVLKDWRQALKILSTRSSEREIALAEIERAKGLRRQALALALPRITATGTLRHEFIRSDVSTLDFSSGAVVRRTVPESPTATAQLSLVQPLLAPRVWHAVGTADEVIRAAELSLSDVRRALVVATANAIVSVVTAERVAEINRVSLAAALERLRLTRVQRRLGVATDLDVVRARQDEAVARASLIQGDEALERAREALGITLGMDAPLGVDRNISLANLEQDAADTCSPAEVDLRPDVLAAKAQLEIARRDIKDAGLRYLPTADLSTALTASTQEFANTKNYGWSIQGVLTVPIWDGGERYGAERAATASADRRQSELAATLRAARLEVNQANRAVRVADQTRDVASAARDLSAETERLATVAFQNGAGTSFDLVDAGRTLREAELELALREFEGVQARIAAMLAASNCRY